MTNWSWLVNVLLYKWFTTYALFWVMRPNRWTRCLVAYFPTSPGVPPCPTGAQPCPTVLTLRPPGRPVAHFSTSTIIMDQLTTDQGILPTNHLQTPFNPLPLPLFTNRIFLNFCLLDKVHMLKKTFDYSINISLLCFTFISQFVINLPKQFSLKRILKKCLPVYKVSPIILVSCCSVLLHQCRSIQ